MHFSSITQGRQQHVFFWKKQENRSYDREKLRPVILCSICTGERVAGFRDKNTGKFSEVMLIRNIGDLEEFRRLYNIDEAEIPTEY